MINNTSRWIDRKEIELYLCDVRKYDALTKEDEILLIEKIKQGCEKSVTTLIYSNLRFVISVAKQYMNQGIELNDLINEGNYGLVKAAKRFDYENSEVRFLSYAVWWIRQSMLQSLHDNSRHIRLPVNVINDINKERKAPLTEFQESENKYAHLPNVCRLDIPIDEEGGSWYDIIEDTNSPRPDMNIASDNVVMLKKLDTILSLLNDTERHVITKFFGLNGEPLTLQDISEDINLTKERVRQIKEKSLKKLRYHSKTLFELL